MIVFNIDIPDKPLTNIDLVTYAEQLSIPYFRGVYMRNELPVKVHVKCGIVNLNTTHQPGSHWVCYYKDGQRQRIYFDSFGQITPIEIQKYLKSKAEFKNDKAVIQRNTDVVQEINTHVCGHLCLFVLKSLANGVTFQNVINTLVTEKDNNNNNNNNNDGHSQGNW